MATSMVKRSGPTSLQRQRGFSMLELVIAGLLIMVLVTVSYRQYMTIVVDAEHAAFNGVRGWLQAGLNMTLSNALGGSRPASLAELEGANPMQLLDGVMVPPSNYLGELSGRAAEQAEPGNWYFDRDRLLLLYRFRYRAAMNGFERAPDNRVGFRLKFVKRSADSRTNRTASGLMLLIETAPFNRAGPGVKQ